VSSVPDRAQLVRDLQDALGIEQPHAEKIARTFDDFVARPLALNLTKLRGRDLVKRNPMIYTARGVTSVEDWVDGVLADKETSAIEGHLGTWMEEVARIVSGGFKPGSGVDLQRDRPDDPQTVELYAIQSAPSTKNAGSRRSDVNALRTAAAVLRASRRRVEMHIAVLSGKNTSTPLRADPNITVLASDEFWEKVSGVEDFRARLIRSTTILSALITGRVADEVVRIKGEAMDLFGDHAGNLDLGRLATPPRHVRPDKRAT
jgi:hypothetical protein